MALRVLLADNSETIKKVIQLTLQDYAAQVRSVNIGIDVVDVAKSFKPDIIFADILLQKRNGYDVCGDIKNTPELANIPVVLIWSGFMDLDQKKYAQVRADAALEKPFDSNDLRQLITQLVPKASEQTLSKYMDMPTFGKSDYQIEQPEPVQTAAPIPPPITPAAPMKPPTPAPSTPPPQAAAPQTPVPTSAPISAPSTQSSDWNMDAFEDINDFQIVEDKKELPDLNLQSETADDFAQVPLNKVSLPPQEKKAVMSKKPNEFELDVPDETDFDGVTVSIVIPQDEVTNIDFLNRTKAPPQSAEPAKAQEPVKSPTKAAPQPATPAAAAPTPAVAALPEEQLEQLLRNYSREIIEKIVWKLVPDMAERIIREEIKRLLDEPEMKA